MRKVLPMLLRLLELPSQTEESYPLTGSKSDVSLSHFHSGAQNCELTRKQRLIGSNNCVTPQV